MTSTPKRVAAEPPPAAATGIVQVVDLQSGEHCWESSPGVLLHGYGFNGQVPGPTIEAVAGDTLAIRFTNLLPVPTRIHWHGLRLSAAMNGCERAAEPVEPERSIEYRFQLPDAGTFWYHPCVEEPVRVHRGLYGALVVRSPEEPRFDGERVLIFDRPQSDPPGPRSRGSRARADRGQHGEHVVLVNGTSQPHMEMASRHIERWRLINAARAEYLRLSLDGEPLVMIGSSGGLLPAPVAVQDLLMAPGDRVDLAVGRFTEVQSLELSSLPHVSAVGADRHKVATLHVTQPGSSATADATVDLNRIRRHISQLTSLAGQPTHTVRLPQRSPRQGTPPGLNGTVPHVVRVGHLQVWDIVNDNAIDQPFHLPGFYFQTLARNGSPPPHLSWQDTATVPARGRIRIAWLPDDRPGRWMYCHHTLERHVEWSVSHFEIVP